MSQIESDNSTEQTPDEASISMGACISHARDLVGSARAVKEIGHANIAYHLAVLALEELGRRELIGVRHAASRREGGSPAWFDKHSQDHVKKLFWCFFGAHFFEEKITKQSLESITKLARHLHTKRLDGLYVGESNGGVSIPSESIDPDECENLIQLAEARLEMAESEKPRGQPSDEDVQLQSWFLAEATHPERRGQIFSSSSMEKLAELKNARAWIGWLKSEFDRAMAEGLDLVNKEIARSKNLPAISERAKWKLRIRIFSASHTIRPKVLRRWNEQVEWIKLVPVPEKKNELIVEFTFRDNVPIQGLWYFAWGVARHFVVALNVGTMGYWWWRLPDQVSRFYESIEDLEQKAMVSLDRSPVLKVDWGTNRVLTEQDLGVVSSCFASLPGPGERDSQKPFDYYIGGLTFLSINDIHWQCESNIFGNFLESLKAMMSVVGDWQEGNPLKPVVAEFLDEVFPGLDEDRDRFLDLVGEFDARSGHELKVTLKEASFAKLFCDAYFLKKMRITTPGPTQRQESFDGNEPKRSQ